LAGAVIRNVPNRRLARDLAAMRALWSADDRQCAGALRDALPADADVGSDPERIWALADQGLCDVRIDWPAHAAQGCFDVTLAPRDQLASPMRPAARPVEAVSRHLATDPLAAAYKQQLGAELHLMLRNALPDAAQPAAVFVVDALPTDEQASPTTGEAC
jgi:hypothetical protein